MDGRYVLLETNGSSVIQAVHTADPGGFGAEVSQRRDGSTSYHHFDGLGSTKELTDGMASVVAGYVYDAFGNVLVDSGAVLNALLYVGQPGYWFESDLGLYFLWARWYDLEPRGGFSAGTDHL